MYIDEEMKNYALTEKLKLHIEKKFLSCYI